MSQDNAIPNYEAKAGMCLFSIIAFAVIILVTVIEKII